MFGKYGLVIADGDDKEFKLQAKELFEKDIFENTSYSKVTESIKQLNDLKYKNQVNPREINCFYLDDNFRGRIEKEGDTYIIGGKKMNAQKLKELISISLEKISPNVVLRPVYQQLILPNIAYVGGPGELAYWLQYKLMFDAYKIQFPILVPRSFISIFDKSSISKIEKLGLEPKDFFKPEEEIVKDFLSKGNQIFELNEEKSRVSESFKVIKEKISSVDASLLANVLAEEQKALNSIDLIAQKANKALKQKSEVQLNQIKQIKLKLFPDKIPQERIENYSSYNINWGSDFLTVIKQHTHSLSLNHNIICEK